MQQTVQDFKNLLWENLKVICRPYFDHNEDLGWQKIKPFFIEVLKQEKESDLKFIQKYGKFDQDRDGCISFIQLGNYLFREHCGLLSLNRVHYARQLKKGSRRLVTLEEFIKLMDQAFCFLGVSFPADVAEYMFKSVDKNDDGDITFAEYLTAIDLHVCMKSKKKMPQESTLNKGKNEGPTSDVNKEPKSDTNEKPNGNEEVDKKEWNSKIRKHIWTSLKSLYDSHVKGRTVQTNQTEIKGLLISIIECFRKPEQDFIKSRLIENIQQKIDFQPFAVQFIYLFAQLGLNRYCEVCSKSQKTLDVSEFTIIIRNLFNLNKYSHILNELFTKIDKDNDGLISFEEYHDWAKRFLAVPKYFGQEFIVPEDDEANQSSIQIPTNAKQPTTRELSVFLLKEIDTDKDGVISSSQFTDFIRRKIGKEIHLSSQPVSTIYLDAVTNTYKRLLTTGGNLKDPFDSFVNPRPKDRAAKIFCDS